MCRGGSHRQRRGRRRFVYALSPSHRHGGNAPESIAGARRWGLIAETAAEGGDGNPRRGYTAFQLCSRLAFLASPSPHDANSLSLRRFFVLRYIIFVLKFTASVWLTLILISATAIDVVGSVRPLQKHRPLTNDVQSCRTQQSYYSPSRCACNG
jgi:hypothetical protein